MSQNINILSTINAVEGFNPEDYAVDYTDLNSKETRKRLPVIAQIAWFRLKYPLGKISLRTEQKGNIFVATARIHPDYKDPVDAYLVEATASRAKCEDIPSVSPRKWAQTAAIGIALRNAGSVSAQMILTEGPMKADVIHELTGISVIAVPGVNTLTQLKTMLEALREEGLVSIRTAFDMDFTTNYHVQNGFRNLLSLLDSMDFKFGTYVWDPRYKGLDDFVWEGMMNKNRGAGD